MTEPYLTLDGDAAVHKLAMVKVYRRWLQVNHRAVPAILDQWEAEAHLDATERHKAPQSDSDQVTPDDGLNERPFLSRTDIQRLTGWSLRTIDRRISTGELPSSKSGRLRCVSRSELDRYLEAA